MSSSLYAQLASLLTYPEAGYHDKLRAAIAAAPASYATDLMEFGATALPMKLEELQERFTAAFDLNPKGTLDLGWHLFGEKYERGLLLVRMRQQLAKYGIAESTELPDHLTHALLLLGAKQSERDRSDSLGGSAHLRDLRKRTRRRISSAPFCFPRWPRFFPLPRRARLTTFC